MTPHSHPPIRKSSFRPSERTSLLDCPSARMVSLKSVLRAGRIALVVLAVCGASVIATSAGVPSCPDGRPSPSPPVVSREALLDLYTRGPLLDVVQRSRLFNDSKHFVDMPIKTGNTPTQILNEFKSSVQPALQANPAKTNDTLLAFLTKYFDEPGSEIQKTIPSDFTSSPTPPKIATIANPSYQKWALDLHALWKELGRSPSRQVLSSYLQPQPLASLGDSSTSTVIVVPGGRFRESYYWDSYWIVTGLLVSNMRTTARRVVQNLLEYVAELGYVPNGGRIYYLTRSQPPMLSDMVRLVATKESSSTTPEYDLEYLRAVVPLLEKEYAYWMSTHRVDMNVLGLRVQLNRYNATVGAPRPESYREDVILAETTFPNDAPRQTQLYNDLAAAAESGWDFSSRWFRDQQTLASIETNDILPVDLNAIMYRVETNLAAFHKALGNDAASERFTKAAADRARAIELVFWDETSGSWRDVDIRNGARLPVVAVSNYYPLWAGAFRGVDTKVDTTQRLGRVVQSLRDSGLIQVAGVQTTTKTTGQQWDAPNAWPPLQDILIEGLLNVNTTDARSLAKDLVRKWIDTSFAAWNKTGLMFEKYNATIVGGLGAGGEYVPQFGFGWTNGVVLKFLTEFKDMLA